MARKMKDSGIEWIGEIPEEWEVKRGKSILTILERPIKPDDKVITCFRNGDVTLRANRREEGFTVSLQETGYQGIEQGDLIVHSMDGFAGAIGISDSRGKATPVLNVMDSTQKKRYIMYYLRCIAFMGVFQSLSTGIRVRSCDTNWNKIKIIPCLIPSLYEQQRIADFLDQKCAQIDEILQKTRDTIAEYKKLKQSIITQAVTKGVRGERPMKDSGIEWIGEIPEEWEVKKLKYCTIFAPNCNTDKFNADTEVTFSPMECIHNGFFENRKSNFAFFNSSYTQYQEGDIVFAKVTPCFENGNIAIMENLFSGFGFGSSELFIVRPITVDTRYLFYFLQNDIFKTVACSTMTGTGGLKRVSSMFVRNYFVLLPEKTEQQEIAAYLDQKCAEIDKLIEKKEQLVGELENYKKSLIYEYVTGKKEVLS